jgi:hypothetical protein
MVWSLGSFTFHRKDPPLTISSHVSVHVILVRVVMENDDEDGNILFVLREYFGTTNDAVLDSVVGEWYCNDRLVNNAFVAVVVAVVVVVFVLFVVVVVGGLEWTRNADVSIVGDRMDQRQ